MREKIKKITQFFLAHKSMPIFALNLNVSLEKSLKKYVHNLFFITIIKANFFNYPIKTHLVL